jgi:flagellar protein FlaG
MSQISVPSVQTQAAPAPASPIVVKPTTEERALTRSASAAVQTLNDAGYAGSGREVTFSLDQATKLPVIKVVDTSTKEVLEQWPQQYLLQLAADSDKLTRDSG